MATCVFIDGINTVKFDGVTCDFHLLSPAEYAQFQSLVSGTENFISLQDIFAIPDASALGLMFQTSFSLVLILWLSSWALGSVVNYFSPKHERY